MNTRKPDQKLKLQLTLKAHDVELLEAATLATSSHYAKHEPRDYHRRWLVAWMIRATARAILANGGKMPVPLAIQLRFEFPEETDARAEISKADDFLKKFHVEPNVVDSAQLVVLAEHLEHRAGYLRELVSDRTDRAGLLVIGSRWN